MQHCVSGALQFVSQEELTEITHGMHLARDGKVWLYIQQMETCFVGNRHELE